MLRDHTETEVGTLARILKLAAHVLALYSGLIANVAGKCG